MTSVRKPRSKTINAGYDFPREGSSLPMSSGTEALAGDYKTEPLAEGL